METNNLAPEHRRGFCPQARVAAVPLAPNILTWDLTGGNRQVGVYANPTPPLSPHPYGCDHGGTGLALA